MARTSAAAMRRRMSIAEAAQHLSVSTKTIRRMIADGRLPAYRVGAQLIRIDPADLDRLLRRIPAAGR